MSDPQITETPLVVTSIDAPDPNPPTPEPQSVRADTAYLILKFLDEGDNDGKMPTLTVAAYTVYAKTPEAAVRVHAETIAPKDLGEGVRLVAISSKFWKPIPVKTKTETTLVIGDS